MWHFWNQRADEVSDEWESESEEDSAENGKTHENSKQHQGSKENTRNNEKTADLLGPLDSKDEEINRSDNAKNLLCKRRKERQEGNVNTATSGRNESQKNEQSRYHHIQELDKLLNQASVDEGYVRIIQF